MPPPLAALLLLGVLCMHLIRHGSKEICMAYKEVCYYKLCCLGKFFIPYLVIVYLLTLCSQVVNLLIKWL